MLTAQRRNIGATRHLTGVVHGIANHARQARYVTGVAGSGQNQNKPRNGGKLAVRGSCGALKWEA
jgi:hypothetical protein